MTHDILDQLTALRLSDDELEQRWQAAARADLSERIRSDELGTQARLRHRPSARLRDHGRPLRSRRVLTGASLVAAAAAAAVVVVPAALPDGTPGGASPAAATALRRLAAIAGKGPADTATSGQFIHTIAREHQISNEAAPTGPDVLRLESTHEEWQATDGRAWVTHTSRKAGGAPRVDTIFAPVDKTSPAPSSLPTDPAALKAYLYAHASGSTSNDEAVFGAISDLLSYQTAKADLRSAAMTILAETDHVSLGSATEDALGRRVQEFDFVDHANRGNEVQALYLDPATAEVIDTRITAKGLGYTSSVVSADVVDAVPAAILAATAHQPPPAVGQGG